MNGLILLVEEAERVFGMAATGKMLFDTKTGNLDRLVIALTERLVKRLGNQQHTLYFKASRIFKLVKEKMSREAWNQVERMLLTHTLA
jgi:hypothetical protein